MSRPVDQRAPSPDPIAVRPDPIAVRIVIAGG